MSYFEIGNGLSKIADAINNLGRKQSNYVININVDETTDVDVIVEKVSKMLGKRNGGYLG